MWLIDDFGSNHTETTLIVVVFLFEVAIFWWRQKMTRLAAFQSLRFVAYSWAMVLCLYGTLYNALPLQAWTALPEYKGSASQAPMISFCQSLLGIGRFVPWGAIGVLLLSYGYYRIKGRERHPLYVMGRFLREFRGLAFRIGVWTIAISAGVVLLVTALAQARMVVLGLMSGLGFLALRNWLCARQRDLASKDRLDLWEIVEEGLPGYARTPRRGEPVTALTKLPEVYELRVELVTSVALASEDDRQLIFCVGLSDPFRGKQIVVWVPAHTADGLNQHFILVVSKPWIRYDPEFRLLEFLAIDGKMTITSQLQPTRRAFLGGEDREAS